LIPIITKYQDEKIATQKTQIITENLGKVIAKSYNINGRELHISTSIGISLFPVRGEDANDVLRQADTAMYRAKSMGHNAYSFFLPSMQAKVEERLRMQNDLRNALNSNQIYLNFQPQVDYDNHIIGAESLVRWQHPKYGLIPPCDFIHIAEETGLIIPLGGYILKSACQELYKWLCNKKLPKSFKYLSINISPVQLRQIDFTEKVIQIIKETKVDPHYVMLEFTENTFIDNIEKTIEKIKILNKIGISFAIDDFGIGYSSLYYLKRLPLEQLKIDKSFIQDITKDDNNARLVETIIVMAQHLNLEIVSEGVETEEQLEFLYKHGCNIYQGFYFSCPISSEQLIKLFNFDIIEQNKGLCT
jgi:EAL domain-containing protein (putative c-di-GMP-specific phosphodiesterase class I)